jgi:hypothetical protein
MGEKRLASDASVQKTRCKYASLSCFCARFRFLRSYASSPPSRGQQRDHEIGVATQNERVTAGASRRAAS